MSLHCLKNRLIDLFCVSVPETLKCPENQLASIFYAIWIERGFFCKHTNVTSEQPLESLRQMLHLNVDLIYPECRDVQGLNPANRWCFGANSRRCIYLNSPVHCNINNGNCKWRNRTVLSSMCRFRVCLLSVKWETCWNMNMLVCWVSIFWWPRHGWQSDVICETRWVWETLKRQENQTTYKINQSRGRAVKPQHQTETTQTIAVWTKQQKRTNKKVLGRHSDQDSTIYSEMWERICRRPQGRLMPLPDGGPWWL